MSYATSAHSRGLAVVVFPQAVEPLVPSPGAIPYLPVRGSLQAHHLRPVLGAGLSLLRACRRSNRRPQDAFGTGDHLSSHTLLDPMHRTLPISMPIASLAQEKAHPPPLVIQHHAHSTRMLTSKEDPPEEA